MVLFLATLAHAQTITVTGGCPGPVTMDVTGLAPGGDAMILAGRGAGDTAVPGGACAGRDSGVAGPLRWFGPVADLDADGAVRLTPTLPPGACEHWVSVVDLGTCDVSEAVPLDTPPRCDGAFATITSPDDVAAYAGCEELDAVYLHITDGVGDVSLPALKTVHDYVYFHQNSGVGRVSLPELETVGGYVYFHQNDGLAHVDLGSLVSVGAYLYFWENTALETVELANLTTVSEYVAIVGNGDLCLDPIDWPSICDDVSSDAPECD